MILIVLAACIFASCGVLSEAKYPAAPNKPKTNGKLRVDTNHTKEGYFLASTSKKSNKRMKMRVVKGKETLT